MILNSKQRIDGERYFSRNPQMKISSDCSGGGGSYSSISRPTRSERMYKSNLVFYVGNDGDIWVAKDRYNSHTGSVNIEEFICLISKVLAELKLKETNLSMFKEGLSNLLQESIKNTLEGDYYERAIQSKSTGDGT